MTDEQHFENGLAMLKTMVGQAEAERIRQGWREISPDLERLILEFVAGRIWTRSGLDLKTRSLSTVAALTALGRTSALELNIRMALGNGATKEDVLEIMLHMAPYAGFPAAWDAMKIAARVFAAA
ncbi:MAG TPA: carboxymuconolactone decarboxylase family protein [Terriglobia bacterium]|nr:carboxymuconolactone decarboxylase family protein [Terriglobia bacterium]